MLKINKGQVARILLGGVNDLNWTIISPDLEGASEEEKVQDRKVFENLLRFKGRTFLKVDGCYNGSRERSYLVVGMSSDDACKIAVFLFQDSYLTKSGLYYRGPSGWYERSNIRGLTVSTVVDDTSLENRSIIYCSDGLLTFTATFDGWTAVEPEVKIEVPTKSVGSPMLAEHLF